MNVALFNYTLLMLLLSVFSSALCLSSFLVSRKRSLGFASLGFFFYFLDIAWIFQDAFVSIASEGTSFAAYNATRTVMTLITGTGCLSSFWLLTCDYLNEHKKIKQVAPPLLFFVISALTLIVLPDGDLRRFAFYTLRMAFVIFMLIYIAFESFRNSDEIDRARFQKHRIFYALIWLFAIAVIIEDALCFLLLDDSIMAFLNHWFAMPERSYAENALMVCCMATAMISSSKALAIRFDERPQSAEGGTTTKQEEIIGETLPLFSKRFNLTERERQVLHLVLQGKTNQEIATEKHLALSTVKVHVHNILQKTESPNRHELVKDFWKF